LTLDITFNHPRWLWALVAIPVIVLAKAAGDLRGRRALMSFTAPRLRAALVAGISTARSWTVSSLQLIALALFILAAAGPRWGEEELPQRESGRNVIICIDCSRSMLATDLAPDRLTRAKLAAQDLLNLLAGDRVGLIVFAGNAYLQAPLTTDHAAVAESIQSVDIFSVPRGGSELGRAIKLAIDTFAKSPARNHGLVVLSDGGEPDPEVTEWAREAAAKRILILAVGVGTREGSLIPDPDPNRGGDYIRDRQGNVVQTALEEPVLRELATTTGGRYLTLGASSLDAGVVNQLLAALERQEGESKSTTKPIERFYWPLSLAIVALVFSMLMRITPKSRQPAPAGPAASPARAALTGGGTVALLVAGAFLAAPVSESAAAAMPGVSQASRLAGEAHEALKNGEFEDAAKLYRESLEKGSSASQQAAAALGLARSALALGQYESAAQAFSRALKLDIPGPVLDAHRGLGHTLYDQGDRALAKQPPFTIRAWTDSLRHFNAALELDPDNAELRENRDFVQKRLDELQEQQRQQQQQQQGGQGQGKGKGKQGDRGGQGQSGGEQEGGEGEEEEGGGKEEGEDEGEGEEGEDGKGGEEGQDPGEGAGDLPEGEISAAGPGNADSTEQAAGAEMDDGAKNDATGFSPNEARSFLRTYADDQKAVQYQRQRQTSAKGKDW
jgi:Ca-activated chloride channel family protein